MLREFRCAAICGYLPSAAVVAERSLEGHRVAYRSLLFLFSCILVFLSVSLPFLLAVSGWSTRDQSEVWSFRLCQTLKTRWNTSISLGSIVFLSLGEFVIVEEVEIFFGEVLGTDLTREYFHSVVRRDRQLET